MLAAANTAFVPANLVKLGELTVEFMQATVREQAELRELLEAAELELAALHEDPEEQAQADSQAAG